MMRRNISAIVIVVAARFAVRTTLEAKAKNITVVIQNSGHRPVQQVVCEPPVCAAVCDVTTTRSDR
jgi:hypothetical protein